ncbi:MAG: AAA family ATPase [archaeon]
MKILITGVPGCGKSTIAKAIKLYFKKLKFEIINDKSFSMENNLGEFAINFGKKEYEVLPIKLDKAFSKFLKTAKSENQIIEGHLWCSLSLKNLQAFDYVFVLVSKSKDLEKVYAKRKYNILKSLENIYSQEINYIQEQLKSKKIKFIEIKTSLEIKKTVSKILKVINL